MSDKSGTTCDTVYFQMATFAFIVVSYVSISALVTADELQDVLFNGNYEFIDLTHTFNNDTVYMPGFQRFEFTKKTEKFTGDDSSWYAAKEFTTAEHGGTHIDAPYHFYQAGKYVGDLPLEKLIVSLIMVDVSSKVNGNADYVLYKKDLDMTNITCNKLCFIMFTFGWSQYFNDSQKYLGSDGKQFRFPGLSTEVADWIIVSNKNVVGIGVDTASVDGGAGKNFAVHKILAKAGLYNVENVNIHRSMNENGCIALVLPMKIEAGTGAPLRIVAICPK